MLKGDRAGLPFFVFVGAYGFGRFLGRKLSLAPPERDPIRANSFRLEAGNPLSRLAG